MFLLYKIVTQLAYGGLYPIARIKAARGNRKWQDRLGLFQSSGKCDIWLHASSVGEVKVLSYLVHYLHKQRPGLQFQITVMTAAGFRVAGKTFDDNVMVSYFPMDSPSSISRALDTVQPSVLVIAETEIWPNLIVEASKRKIRVVLINGRMSDKAFRRYRTIRLSMRKLLTRYDRFFFKTESDAGRFVFFGVTSDKQQVTGDMKFDAPLFPQSEGRKAEIRYRAGIEQDQFMIVAGSTRSGEEAMLLDMFRKLSEAVDGNWRMVLAPRHIERADEVKQLCQNVELTCARYGKSDKKAQVVIVDRMGVLMDLYMAADIAFVGGTLVEIGGHNILEPVWTGTPVIFGPHLSNVTEAAEYIQKHNYGIKLATVDDLGAVIQHYRSGEMTFSTKTDHDLSNSPTALAGDYILSRLPDA